MFYSTKGSAFLQHFCSILYVGIFSLDGELRVFLCSFSSYFITILLNSLKCTCYLQFLCFGPKKLLFCYLISL